MAGSGASPIVSVVVPFLNTRDAFFRQAVESVLTQTFGDWELLLVDDGSVGQATEIARQYARSDPERVRYLEFDGHANRGAPAARNLGLQHARGAYVASLDADDVWVADKLERQLEIFRRWPRTAMVYGTSRYWFGWTGRAVDAKRDFVQRHAIAGARTAALLGDQLIEPPALLIWYLRGEAAVPPPSSVIVRRSVMLAVGGFEPRFTLYEDQTLYAKVCATAPVFVANECWDAYRQHQDSMCARARSTDRETVARLAYLEWLSGYLGGIGLRDALLWRELRRQLWMARNGKLGRIVGSLMKRLRPLVGTPSR